MEILISNEQDKVNIEENISDILKDVVLECLNLEQKSSNYEVSITFVDDDEIKELNNQYRSIDKSTDVLSFPMYEEEEDTPYIPLLGDIIISAETAKRQAEEFGHTVDREIAYLTAHSMFHLLGYDHMEDSEKKLMRDKEKQIMKKLGIFKNENK